MVEFGLVRSVGAAQLREWGTAISWMPWMACVVLTLHAYICSYKAGGGAAAAGARCGETGGR